VSHSDSSSALRAHFRLDATALICQTINSDRFSKPLSDARLERAILRAAWRSSWWGETAEGQIGGKRNPTGPKFLSVIEKVAPGPLAQAAATLLEEGPAEWQQAIESFWHSDLELAAAVDDPEQVQAADSPDKISADRLLAWIFLQPYAEYLADHREIAIVDGTPSTCPLCGGKPIVGVLRSEGDGAKKSLICMLCAHEWAFRRIYCPACGEEREPQMAFYSAPEIAHVRVDVCDTCHTYLKSIDLTKTGLAVPVVDELATIPLDLWARVHGYVKLQINLLGT
jgi:formate dehydrogenase maturation protein FdhE